MITYLYLPFRRGNCTVGVYVKRVNIALKDDVHTKAKLIAVLKDTTLNSYFEDAIEAALEKDRNLLEKLKRKL
ncbi:MAG: hypothetical protein ABIJ21_03785 [Nanoarchaeota archaeon]